MSHSATVTSRRTGAESPAAGTARPSPCRSAPALKRDAAIGDGTRHPESLRHRERTTGAPEAEEFEGDELAADETDMGQDLDLDEEVNEDGEGHGDDESTPRRGPARRRRST